MSVKNSSTSFLGNCNVQTGCELLGYEKISHKRLERVYAANSQIFSDNH